ncbi:MAG TPA: hypothetical protein VKY22_03465 [Bradyrhizobium sp.]|nr:hypothetical protein [Bradyrhizobium sp.]
MFDQGALRDELQSLKVDLASMLSSAGEDMLNSSKARADALADQIKAALADLGDVLAEENGQIGRLVADRPVASLASAFALGVVVGLALRRH